MNDPRAIGSAEVATASSGPFPAEERSRERADQRLEVLLRKRRHPQGQEFLLEVQFQSEPGFTILFGPSGAGKTTVLDCVAGLAKPDSGRIAVGDRVLFDAAQAID